MGKGEREEVVSLSGKALPLPFLLFYLPVLSPPFPFPFFLDLPIMSPLPRDPAAKFQLLGFGERCQTVSDAF